MLPFQNCANVIVPDAMATNASASQAMIHMFSSASPRSAGTSCASPRAIGHVITTVIATNAIAAITVCAPRLFKRRSLAPP